jgi:FHA domain-containing protein
VPELKIPGGVTPEFMNLMGKLLHESVRGTLDLLLARALTKREVRAQATVIVARENNPLKFSPTVEAAFTNLLALRGQGFMGPADAMRDAYNDLRSHQFGFMAGMRAALEGVLARFDPAQLEGRLTHKSVLGSLVPASRRARLWELYEQLYREISKEAQDDFQTLFGKEFLRAYEAQIDKLEQEDAATKR